jgi:hypothetical protein
MAARYGSPMTNTDTAAADTTLTFPNHFAKILAEAAIKRDREQQDRFHKLVELADPGRREHVDRFITLDVDTHVFEIADGNEPPLYGVIHKGAADAQRFYGIDEALLRAVALRAGARSSDQGHIYAARALGVKPTVDY